MSAEINFNWNTERVCPRCKQMKQWREYQKYKGEICDLCNYREIRAWNRDQREKEQERIRKLEAYIQRAPGFVYLVKSPTGYYKIGHAGDVKRRTKVFTVKLPFETELVHTIKCKNRFQAERFLHGFFANKRGEGEWFALTAEDIEQIKSIKEL